MAGHARKLRRLSGFTLITALASQSLSGYSVLSHEALVDALWEVQLKPTLLKRYPSLSPEQLKEAHAYAYGGAIIQDMGYYPHGSEFFSDLTHYVRSGDLVTALLREAQTPDEFSFALGAFTHYFGDNDGHPTATNRGEPMLYPKLRKRFGDVVTYEDNPADHLKTEFGFDVLEVAKGHFAPEAYHDFIGFEVAVPVLERAFRDTYSLELKDVFSNLDVAVGSYRYTVSKIIPLATRVAWARKKDDIQKAWPGETHRKFLYVMRRSSYEKEWGKAYDRPSAGDEFLAFLLRLLPPIGPLRTLRYRMPTPPVEKLFMESFIRATNQFRAESGSSSLSNTNLDTGVVTPPGVYKLNDKTHAELLHQLAKRGFTGIGASVRAEILLFYASPNALINIKRKDQPRIQDELARLRESGTNAAQAEEAER